MSSLWTLEKEALTVPIVAFIIESMKNKEDKTVHELVNLIMEVCKKSGRESSTSYAYALGTLQSMLDWAVRFPKDSIQENINSQYKRISHQL